MEVCASLIYSKITLRRLASEKEDLNIIEGARQIGLRRFWKEHSSLLLD
jgi:hypothetical protein